MLRKIPEPWREYRSRHIVAVSGLLLGLPLAFFIALAWALWVKAYAMAVLTGVMITWCIFWGWAAFRVVRCPCPRCGETWLSNQDVRIGAFRRCAKCGLALYEAP